MLASILEGLVISSVCWFLWKYFRQAFVKSSLDNIPGPPAGSFLYGTLNLPISFDYRILMILST